MIYTCFYKRCFDIISSFVIIVLLSPLFLIILACLIIANRGNPFFIQKRPGKKEKIFSIIKLCTMNNLRDNEGNLLPDKVRLTKIGKFVRSTSIDELPQLINVLKGDMSFIGPRPLLVEYLPLYTKEQARRHDVRPGITGWAQVNGRNAISWNQKFNYDIEYVDNLSFGLDVKIVLLTINRIVKRDNISSKTAVTMEKFNGEN